MNTILVWDTETTGLPLFKEPSEDPRQPHIVQLACSLVDTDSRKTLASINLVAKPDGWDIPAEVASIHGITTEHARQVGVPERDVVALFLALGAGRTHVAHNSSFDERIVRIALKRYFGDEASDEFRARKFECTATLATPICAIPPTARMVAAGFNKFKTANLQEAHTHLCGKPFEGAHSALADVQACAAVYFAINERTRGESGATAASRSTRQ